MLKRTFSIIFTFFILLSASVSAGAYEFTGFTINANAAMLVSLDTGELLYSKNADAKVYPASITKIMTVTLILESELYQPDSKIAMTSEVLKMVLGTGSSVSNLKKDEEISQLDLVYLVLMASYGDCAYLAAQYYGGSVEQFVTMMNDKAAELGLKGTHYSNPVGLHDEGTYTTANDIYTLTKYALKNETFKTVCESARYKLPATNFSNERTISTTNYLQDTNTNYYYSYAKGVKTGFTDEAGRCLVSTASYNGYSYMCILMGEPNTPGKRHEFIDSRSLYRWAFNSFEFKEVASSENPICEIPVELSMDADFVPLYIENGFISIIPKDADTSTIVIKTHLKNESTDAPVKKGDVLGTADIVFAEQVLGTVNLVAGNDIEASRLLKIMRSVKNVFNSLFIKVLLGLAALAVLIFIIMCIVMNIGRGKKRHVKYIPYKGDNHHEK